MVKDLVSDTQVMEALADELSVGQQQKLALSLALSQQTDCTDQSSITNFLTG